jgi:O-acetyl-ADP-ribose deacetylase (regulator of RNase III)
MPFSIVRQDFTQMKVDAIVNAANTSLHRGGGVCGAIFRAAGTDELQAACDPLAPIQTGEAVITPGFKLPAKYIIHTAGPVYRDGLQGEETKLQACYLNSLKLATQTKCKSIAFPLISSGIYGYPKAEALRVANEVIQKYLANHDLSVYLAVFDKEAFTVSEKLLGDVKSYIDEHYVDQRSDLQYDRNRRNLENFDICYRIAPSSDRTSEADVEVSKPTFVLDELVVHLDEPFSTTLLRLIDAKGKNDVDVYKKANLDRKLFSKIRTGKYYIPSKRTVVALAVALELSRDEADVLLACAGYALSRSQKFDVIVEYFIVNQQYDIFAINEVLFRYDQPLLGA